MDGVSAREISVASTIPDIDATPKTVLRHGGVRVTSIEGSPDTPPSIVIISGTAESVIEI